MREKEEKTGVPGRVLRHGRTCPGSVGMGACEPA